MNQTTLAIKAILTPNTVTRPKKTLDYFIGMVTGIET
jgi:hypothetical protein